MRVSYLASPPTWQLLKMLSEMKRCSSRSLHQQPVQVPALLISPLPHTKILLSCVRQMKCTEGEFVPSGSPGSSFP